MKKSFWIAIRSSHQPRVYASILGLGQTAVKAVKYDYFGSYSRVAVHGDPEIARLYDKNEVYTKVDTKIPIFIF